MINLRSLWTPLALGALVLAACGGGDNARNVLTADDTTPTTDAAPATDAPLPTDPPATDPPTSDAPVTTDTPVSTDPSTDPAGDIAAFCGASEQFFVEASALNSIDGDDDVAARALFADMGVSVSGAIFNAPTPEIAAAPQRMQEVFATLLPALDAVNYDIDAVNELPNADEVNAGFAEFGEIADQLQGFIVAECGSDLAALETAATAKAAEVSGTPGPASTDPVSSDPVPATTIADTGSSDVGAVEVVDNSETISVTVPSTWTDVNGAPDGELRQLIAAPDNAAFLAGFDSPGVILVAGDAPAGNGGDAGIAGLDGLSAAVEGDGCALAAEVPYDDGVYTGTERTYGCPGTDAIARFAGGTNSEGNVFWLLGVVYEPANADTWTLVTESFLVD